MGSRIATEMSCFAVFSFLFLQLVELSRAQYYYYTYECEGGYVQIGDTCVSVWWFIVPPIFCVGCCVAGGLYVYQRNQIRKKNEEAVARAAAGAAQSEDVTS